MNLRDDITEAVAKAGIEGFSFVRQTKWEGILNQIAERFLNRGVRDLESIWLWDSFKKVVASSQPEDPHGYLRQQIDPVEVYWFIASDEIGNYWVADATGTAIVRTIEEMYDFEYYIADRHLNWLLCENHHSIFIKAMPMKNSEGEQVRDGDAEES